MRNYPAPFPIPVVADSPLPVEEENLSYLDMPKGMDTYQQPLLPEPEEISGHDQAVQVLHDIAGALEKVTSGASPEKQSIELPLHGLDAENLKLLNQVLGEGEVSAQILGSDGKAMVQIQESVFAGVWRVVRMHTDDLAADYIEVASIPSVIQKTARADASGPEQVFPSLPDHVVNVPSILTELASQRKSYGSDKEAHVVNLTLLPLSHEDIAHLDHRLGTGSVLILSRGYGNCRITNCKVANTWRVVYYNSQDAVILNSVEVTDVPEVAMAATEDLQDSLQRIREVMQWVQQA